MVNSLANFKALSGFSGRERIRDDKEVTFIMDLKASYPLFHDAFPSPNFRRC
jgi:hypothetical protein